MPPLAHSVQDGHAVAYADLEPHGVSDGNSERHAIEDAVVDAYVVAHAHGVSHVNSVALALFHCKLQQRHKFAHLERHTQPERVHERFAHVFGVRHGV